MSQELTLKVAQEFLKDNDAVGQIKYFFPTRVMEPPNNRVSITAWSALPAGKETEITFFAKSQRAFAKITPNSKSI